MYSSIIYSIHKLPGLINKNCMYVEPRFSVQGCDIA